MRLGVGLPVSGHWATPANMRRVAMRAEELGYDSLWTFQRLLHPLDQEWGAPYHRVHDPVTSLAYVAALTSRVRLGIAVVNVPNYAPIVLAKELTTLDVVSDGRLDVGLGLGWAPQEFAAVGAERERRGARAEEFVGCLDAIWTAGEVEFSGEFYEVPRCRVEPKPVQSPRPPILMGGGADRALRRIGRIADGWISSSRTDIAEIGRSVGLVRAAAAEAGRDSEALRFVVRGAVRPTPHPVSDRGPLQGSADQISEDLVSLAGQGVTETFLDLNFDPDTVGDDVDPAAAMDRAERMLDELAPS